MLMIGLPVLAGLERADGKAQPGGKGGIGSAR